MQAILAAGALLSFDMGSGFVPGPVSIGGHFRKRSKPPKPTDRRARVKAARAANVARMRRGA